MFEIHTIMTEDVLTVHPDTSVDDALRILVDENVTGLPVVDHANHLVGMVSEKDMLRLLYDPDDHVGTLVKEVMSRNVVTCDWDAQLHDVCEILINSHFRRLPVMKEGKLVGIVSRSDVIKFILDLRRRMRRLTSGSAPD